MKQPDHFEKFQAEKAKKRLEKLKILYHANLMLRYQECLLEINLKEEKAKAKVHAMRGDGGVLSKTADMNEMLRLKLENDRLREKIAALDKALFEVASLDQRMTGSTR